MYCPNCGSSVADGGTRCPACGTSMKAPEINTTPQTLISTFPKKEAPAASEAPVTPASSTPVAPVYTPTPAPVPVYAPAPAPDATPTYTPTPTPTTIVVPAAQSDDPHTFLEKHPEYRPLSAWGYIARSILYSLPLIGLIFSIIFSFNSSNLNRRSFARSFALVYLVAGVIVICAAVLIFAFGTTIVGISN